MQLTNSNSSLRTTAQTLACELHFLLNLSGGISYLGPIILSQEFPLAGFSLSTSIAAYADEYEPHSTAVLVKAMCKLSIVAVWPSFPMAVPQLNQGIP